MQIVVAFLKICLEFVQGVIELALHKTISPIATDRTETREEFVSAVKAGGYLEAIVRVRRSPDGEHVSFVAGGATQDRTVLFTSAPIRFPINPSDAERQILESQLRTFARFLQENDISLQVLGEEGYQIKM